MQVYLSNLIFSMVDLESKNAIRINLRGPSGESVIFETEKMVAKSSSSLLTRLIKASNEEEYSVTLPIYNEDLIRQLIIYLKTGNAPDLPLKLAPTEALPIIQLHCVGYYLEAKGLLKETSKVIEANFNIVNDQELDNQTRMIVAKVEFGDELGGWDHWVTMKH